MGIWSDLLGTLNSYFRIGGPVSGVRLKNNSNVLEVKDATDAAYVAATAAQLNATSNVGLVINSDAASAGADWKLTLQRPATGMAADVVLTLPPDDGTADQVLRTDGAGVLTWVSAGTTASSEKVDTTSLAFGSSSPVAMFNTGAADVINFVRVIIDTAFNGTPTASVGITGTTSKYMASTQIDLTAPAGTVFEVHPGLAAQGAESLIVTYAAGGASAGAARVEVGYDTPS
jgi:hypothetical protein